MVSQEYQIQSVAFTKIFLTVHQDALSNHTLIEYNALGVFKTHLAFCGNKHNMSRFNRPSSDLLRNSLHSKRTWCLCTTVSWVVFILLWMFTERTEALANLTDSQCDLVLLEFKKTFVPPGTGYPLIQTCDTRIVGLLWDQQIVRVYSSPDFKVDTYDKLRLLPEDQFAKLVINAAAGSLLDTTQTASDDAMIRIRVNSQGHFRRYVLNDTSRVTSLQTMLVISIVTLAVTWWKLATTNTKSKPESP